MSAATQAAAPETQFLDSCVTELDGFRSQEKNRGENKRNRREDKRYVNQSRSLYSFEVTTTGMVGAGSLHAAATSSFPAFTLPARPGFLCGGSVSSNTLCHMRLYLS